MFTDHISGLDEQDIGPTSLQWSHSLSRYNLNFSAVEVSGTQVFTLPQTPNSGYHVNLCFTYSSCVF